MLLNILEIRSHWKTLRPYKWKMSHVGGFGISGMIFKAILKAIIDVFVNFLPLKYEKDISTKKPSVFLALLWIYHLL